MNIIKQFAMATTLAMALASVAGLSAQPLASEKAGDLSTGEVRKIDRDAMKITLKHGEIKNMDMPPMTMVFKVLDPALLDKVKAGDKVNFSAEKRDGAIVVTGIEVAK